METNLDSLVERSVNGTWFILSGKPTSVCSLSDLVEAKNHMRSIFLQYEDLIDNFHLEKLREINMKLEEANDKLESLLHVKK